MGTHIKKLYKEDPNRAEKEADEIIKIFTGH